MPRSGDPSNGEAPPGGTETPTEPGAEEPGATGAPGSSEGTGPTLAPRDGVPAADVVDFGIMEPAPDDIGLVCAAQSAASELRQVYLAFALDVSASMGQRQGQNDDRRFNLKWLPVITAAEAFFSEPESAAISASLTFFPAANNNTWCDAEAYVSADVPQTLLPSNAFTDAITALNRTPDANWRTATPTLAVFEGMVASLRAIPDASPNVTHAVVLVTDGIPQNCNQAVDNVEVVAQAVRDSGMRTFVVGVTNPPGLDGGENLDNLNVIAEAGGTERAFIVQTGDPVQTEADFKAVIDVIRGVSVSCNIEIPLPPADAEFIPEKVNVTYSGAAGETALKLSYDPECLAPDSWRYDDPAAPASIVLCGDTCGTVQRDVTASLNVEFGCDRRVVVR